MAELISIVTTLFNYRQYITDLISSCYEQKHKNWELIIVDDGSTDNPLKVIKHYLGRGNIVYVRFDENHGYSFAKNEAIVRARGDYIVMIDADDMLTPESLLVRYHALKSNPARLWVHGTGFKITKDGKRRAPETFCEKERIKFYGSHDVTKVYDHSIIHAQSVMMRRKFYETMGLYDEELRCSSDKEMWKRAIRMGHFPLFVNAKVFLYRSHPAQMSESSYKKKINAQLQALLEKNLQRRIDEGITAENTRLLEIKSEEA
jgi:GT2 family glycosyltransferase